MSEIVDLGAEAEELDEWMAGGVGDAYQITVDTDADSVTRQHVANVLLYRIGRARRKLARYRALVDAQKDRAEAFYARVAGPWQRRIAEAEATIDVLMRAEHLADAQIKTLHLPNGTVTWREPPVARLVIDDEEVAVAWLEANGHVKVTKTVTVVRKDDMKKLGVGVPMDRPEGSPDLGVEWFRVAVDGEIVPGLHLERQTAATVKASPAT